jgi:aspartyl-tRNA(Asn)/glutamyl-tRNA(Gln) amidotransferase subunit C
VKVSAQDVAKVAILANLDLTEGERNRMVRDLNSILEYIDVLNRLDTSTVEPMGPIFSAHEDTDNNENDENGQDFREDILEGLRKSLPHEEAMANALQTDGTFFRVPKVIER